MIEFYPRDIGLWREVFDFETARKTGVRPSMNFQNREDLISFVKQHYDLTIEEENKFPVKLIEEENVYFGTTHVVYRWTVIGLMKEVSEKVMEDKKDDNKTTVLPVYDISWDEWIIQLEDGSFKRISHEEYVKLYVFKTQYDVERSDDLG